jgi:hypothetical protein
MKGAADMRKAMFSVLCLFMFGTTEKASAGSEWLLRKYEKEANVVYRGMCDQGRISYTTYWKAGRYVIELALVDSKDAFYMMRRYVGKNEGWQQRYLMWDIETSTLTELSREEWEEEVKVVSVNYLNKLHGLETSCSRALVIEENPNGSAKKMDRGHPTE